MPSTKHVFISHAAEDAAFAQRLAALFADAGATVESDAEPVFAGAWAESLRSKIETASALVVLIPSEKVRDRNNVWFEVGAAKALGKRVLAVLPPESRSNDLPPDLADVVVLDAGQRSLDAIAGTLLNAVPEPVLEQ